jgi:hypothetical protein
MWPEPTAPAGRRLPSAPRERKPALAALAVLLIVGGAAAAGLLVIKTGKRVAAIEISQQVSAGQQIPLSAMQEVQVASGTGVNYVAWNEASQVARTFADTTIPAGTLLTSQMTVGANSLTVGKDIVGLSLSAGRMPFGLHSGDHVVIYSVGSSGGGSATAGGGCSNVQAGTPIVDDAVITQVAGSSSSGGTTEVMVAVDQAHAGALVCSSSAGNVAIAQLPSSTSATGSGAG